MFKEIKFAIMVITSTILVGQARTYTPLLRADHPAGLTFTQVDANFSSTAGVANTAARCYFATTQAAMLALSPTPQAGDLCYRSDIGYTWTFAGGDPTTLGNWRNNSAGNYVYGVFGRMGNVVATAGDYTVDQVTGALPKATTAGVPTLANSEIGFQLVSNTSLKITVKGSDGVVRSATLTLAP